MPAGRACSPIILPWRSGYTVDISGGRPLLVEWEYGRTSTPPAGSGLFMKKTVAVCAFLLLFAANAFPAGIFSWGTSKMKDGFEEIREEVDRIVDLVKADGRVYRSYLDYKTTIFTMEKKIDCMNRMIVAGDDILIEEANGCLIVAGGDVEINRAVDSIILAEGRVTSRWRESFVKNSLVATQSRINFGGHISDSTIHARNGAKIEYGANLTAYSTKDVEVRNLANPVIKIEGKPIF